MKCDIVNQTTTRFGNLGDDSEDRFATMTVLRTGLYVGEHDEIRQFENQCLRLVFIEHPSYRAEWR